MRMLPAGMARQQPVLPAIRQHLPSQGEGSSEQIGDRFSVRILRAAGWTMSGYLGVQILRIASSLILTRLLVPEMFGLMAVATMVQVAVAMLSDLGIRPAAIQSRMGDRQAYLDTAWTLQIVHGLTIWVVCVGVAFAITAANARGLFPKGSVYTEPVLPAVIVATCFCTVIAGFQSTKVISAYRELALAQITKIEVIAQIVSLGIAIILAVTTGSVWSFVVAILSASAVTTGLSFLLLPGPGNRLRLEPAAVRDLVRFGKWVLLSSTFTVLAANGDRILLAGWISPRELGLYILAFNLILMLEGAGNRLFSSVAIPALSKIHRDQPDRLPITFSKLRLPFDLLFVIAAGATFAAGDVVVNVLYDQRYEAAGQMLKILSFSLLISRFGVLSNVYLAIGKPRYLTILNFVRSVSIFILLPLGHYLYGLEGALWAIALHGLPGVVMLVAINSRYGFNNPRLEVVVLFGWAAGWLLGQIARWGTHVVGFN